MSGTVTLRGLIDALEAEGLLRQSGAAAAYLEDRAEVQPWYVRTMVGFGAWLASLLLIGFVAGFSIAVGGYTVVGIALVIGATALRWRSDNDFFVQCALASSLAGQALLAYGFAEILGGEEFETFLGFVVVVSAVLFFAFPDRIHRVIMVLFAASALTMLIYAWELNAFVPVLGPIFAAALVGLHRNMPALIASGHGAILRPLSNGLMLSAFGALLLSTIYILPELGVEFAFYPRPWVSTVLLGALFLYVGGRVWSTLAETSSKTALTTLYALSSIVIISSWAAPGLLLSLIVVMLGAESGRRSFIGAGISFLVVFVACYFYGIETTMMTKSITLVATGSAILLSRWVILKVIATPIPTEAQRV